MGAACGDNAEACEGNANAGDLLIDATIVRAVLLPAAMKLLGEWNWYLPKHLGWLPKPGRQQPRGEQLEPALEPNR